MTNFEPPPRYHIYLLTIWEERGQETGGGVAWRFRLEDSSTGQQQGFANLEALVAVLEQVLAD
jgi:hypothetical protein